MPFANSASISLNDVRSYFGAGGSLSLNELHQGNSSPYGYIQTSPLNSSMPSGTSAISFSDITGKYARKSADFTFTAGSNNASLMGYSFPSSYDIGTISGSNTFVNGVGSTVRFLELVHFPFSSSLQLSIGNTATTPSLGSWSNTAHTSLFRLLIIGPSNNYSVGDFNFIGYNTYGSQGVKEYTVPYANNIFTNGSSYTARIYWLQ